jgi:glucosyl-3-phosphoglycerate phosphatase
VTEVVFVRHGATAWSGRRYCGRSDPPMHAAGVAAVASMAATLAPSLPPDVRIISSPSGRARGTAEAIAGAARIEDAEVEVDERWLEADFGFAEGRTFDELTALAPDLAKALARGETAIDWPGGETAAALATRVEAALDDIISRAVPTVVVSHAGPLRLAMGLALGRRVADVDVLEPAATARVQVVREPADRPTVLGSLS